MTITAAYPFRNGTVTPLVGPEISTVRSGIAYAIGNDKNMTGRFAANKPRFANCKFTNNYLTYSNTLSNAAWTKVNCTVALDSDVTDHWGDAAWKLTDDATSGVHGIYYADITFASPTNCNTLLNRVVYLKEGTARYVTVSATQTGTSISADCTIDLRTGEIVDGAEFYQWYYGSNYGYNSHEFITDMGDGWYAVDCGHLTGTNNSFGIFVNPDGVTANGSYVGTSQYIYVSKPRVSDLHSSWGRNQDYETDYTPTEASGDVVGISLTEPRFNFILNSELLGYAGKGTTPYQYGYSHAYAWAEGTTTGSASARPSIIKQLNNQNYKAGEDVTEVKLDTFPADNGTGAWATTRAGNKTKMACHVSGTNQQYHLTHELTYSGRWNYNTEHTFSILIEEITTIPTEPVVVITATGLASSGTATITLDENTRPGDRVSCTFTSDYTVAIGNPAITIGLGANGTNDTGDFVWSSPQLEVGGTVRPYIPTMTTNYSEFSLYPNDEFGTLLPDVGLLSENALTEVLTDPNDYRTANWTSTGATAATQGLSYKRGQARVFNKITGTGGGSGTIRHSQAVTTSTSTQYTLVCDVNTSATEYIYFGIENMSTYAINGYAHNVHVGGEAPSVANVGANVTASGVDYSPNGGSQRFWITFTSHSSDTACDAVIGLATAATVGGQTVSRVSSNTASASLSLYEGAYRPYSLMYDENIDAMDVNTATIDSNWYTQGQGTVFLDVTTPYFDSGGNHVMCLFGTTADNDHIMIYRSGSDGKMKVWVVNATATVGLWVADTVMQENTRYKIAVAFDDDDIRVYIDGNVAGTAITSVSMPTNLEHMGIGTRPSTTGSNFNGVIHNLIYMDHVADNTELSRLSHETGFPHISWADGTHSIHNENHRFFCHRWGEENTPTGYRNAFGKAMGWEPYEYVKKALPDLFRQFKILYNKEGFSLPVVEGVSNDPYIGEVLFLPTLDDATAGAETFTAEFGSLNVSMEWNLVSGTQPTQVDGEVSIAQAKFGKSIYYKEAVSTPTAGWQNTSGIAGSAISMGSGDFTLDCWIYNESGHVSEVLLLQSWLYTDYLWDWHLNADVGTDGWNTMTFQTSSDGTTSNNQILQHRWGGIGVPQDQWNHMAICKSGNNYYAFLNGQISDQGVQVDTSTMHVPAGNVWLCIGQDAGGLGGNDVSTYMEMPRITKGVARWITNFTPPTRSEY